MREDTVEIFADISNSAIMRHPGRRFPGVLIQGDTLYSMCQRADFIAQEMGRETPGYEDMNDLRNHLWSLLSHYKTVLVEHGVEIPFSEQPRT